MLNFVCLLKLNYYIYNCFLFSSLSTKQVLFIIHGFYFYNLPLSTNFITSLYMIITHGFYFLHLPLPLLHLIWKMNSKCCWFLLCIWFRIELLPFALCLLPVVINCIKLIIKPLLAQRNFSFILTFACACKQGNQGKQAFLLAVVCIIFY